MKMKVTHRGGCRKESLTVPKAPLIFPSSEIQVDSKPAQRPVYETDDTQDRPTVSAVDIVTPKAPVLHSQV